MTRTVLKHFTVDGGLGGEVWLYHNNGRVELDDLYVPLAHRGQGIGKRLLSRALVYADVMNWPVWLRVQAFDAHVKAMSNEALIAMYERHGFVRIPDTEEMLWQPPSMRVT